MDKYQREKPKDRIVNFLKTEVIEQDSSMVEKHFVQQGRICLVQGLRPEAYVKFLAMLKKMDAKLIGVTSCKEAVGVFYGVTFELCGVEYWIMSEMS